MSRKTNLSHHERVRLSLAHEETDRIPIAMVCSGVNELPVLEEYLQRERGISVKQYFKPIIDIIEIEPKYIGPSLKQEEDYWGVIREKIEYAKGYYYDEIAYYPLAKAKTVANIASHRWPSTEWFDYSTIADQIKELNRKEEYCIMVKGGNIFETSWYVRGFEQSFMDMVNCPELIESTMEMVTQFYIAHTQKVLEAAEGMVDLVVIVKT